MWKKAAWVYIAIYIIGVCAININSIVSKSAETGFDSSVIIPFLLFLVPAAMVIFELLGLVKTKWFAFIHILAFLFVIIMVVGIFNFNTPGIEMIGKALLFIPMLGCLGYYIYTRLIQKKKPAAAE
jgi:hypothetical protein